MWWRWRWSRCALNIYARTSLAAQHRHISLPCRTPVSWRCRSGSVGPEMSIYALCQIRYSQSTLSIVHAHLGWFLEHILEAHMYVPNVAVPSGTSGGTVEQCRPQSTCKEEEKTRFLRVDEKTSLLLLLLVGATEELGRREVSCERLQMENGGLRETFSLQWMNCLT